MMQLDVRDAAVAYGNKTVIEGVSFSLASGEIGCLLGPSGCGKTSLLRAIAGFEPLSSGEIDLHGRSVSAVGQTLSPEQRRIGMVFQEFALFPHLSVAKNVGFGLEHMNGAERSARVEELLSLVGMSHLANVHPHQLSGGQQQRIALIRAMAPRPEILLMDEPFSSLDTELREQLAREVRNLLKRDNITAILVTHDQMEAFAMADSIGVVGEGRLHQWANGYTTYHNPSNRFVAGFIGQGVMLPGQIVDGGRVQTEIGIIGEAVPTSCQIGADVELLLRPDDVIHDDESKLQLEVKGKDFRGAEYLYTLLLPSGQEILCMVQSHHNHNVGESIGIRLDVEDVALFPAR
ncbi:ABC transporter ATP-binding protein [Solemya pervernicosa gill symbiont]|nr:ABC transporter ATP-binding protein [Solemya pervernicosa gill symbiont]